MHWLVESCEEVADDRTCPIHIVLSHLLSNFLHCFPDVFPYISTYRFFGIFSISIVLMYVFFLRGRPDWTSRISGRWLCVTRICILLFAVNFFGWVRFLSPPVYSFTATWSCEFCIECRLELSCGNLMQFLFDGVKPPKNFADLEKFRLYLHRTCSLQNTGNLRQKTQED